MNTIASLLISLYCSFIAPTPQTAVAPVKVVLKMTDIRSSSGSLKIGIYKDQMSFEQEKPLMKKTIYKKTIAGGVVVYEFVLEPGTYGVALLDDENDNGDMDFRLLLPKEGYGFSNYYHTGLTKPNFSKFSFPVTAGGVANVTIKVKYM